MLRPTSIDTTSRVNIPPIKVNATANGMFDVNRKNEIRSILSPSYKG